MTTQELQIKIQTGLPGALVEIQDPMSDGVHLKAVIIFNGFEGKTLLEQHRMVYDLLKEELAGELHALALETKTSQ